jgi:hypothetical protein
MADPARLAWAAWEESKRKENEREGRKTYSEGPADKNGQKVD